MKKQALRVVAFCMVFILVLSLAASAMAANKCSQVSDSAKSARVFDALTDGNFRIGYDKVVLTQPKGDMWYEDWSCNQKTTKTYAWYTVKVVDKRTGKVIVNNTWKDGQHTIYLPKQNTGYRITITPCSITQMNTTAGGILRTIAGKRYVGWKTHPTWSVTRTRGVDFCW